MGSSFDGCGIPVHCDLDRVLVPQSVEIVLQAGILKVFGRLVLRGLILQVVALLEFSLEVPARS